MRKNPHATKAYHNREFLNSAHARTLRILAEYLDPLRRMKEENVHGTIVFFGSSRLKPRKKASDELKKIEAQLKTKPTRSLKNKLGVARHIFHMSRYYDDAVELARLLTLWSKSLKDGKQFVVCTGGGPGIMEAANRGAKKARGKSIGMNISISTEQEPNPYISPELNFEFHYFFMRKLWFSFMARALVVFPGGFGTMDELMEMLTLLQTGKTPQPLPIVLYGEDYWRGVIDFDRMVALGTISKKDLRLFHYANSPEEAFDYLISKLSDAK